MFGGQCALFAGGTWNESSGKLEVRWPTFRYCDFAMVSAVFCFIVSLYNAVRLVMGGLAN